MARIREIVPSTQNIRAHRIEDAVTCQYKVIDDENGETLLHLSTFGSQQRQSSPKSSQSIQLSRENAAELITIIAKTFGFDLGSSELVAAEDEASSSHVDPVFAEATDALAEAVFMPKGWLQECIDLLRDRPQLIFYGPPGTGKTYLAKAIAMHLCDERNVKVVQFHPSYSYEDFFEGLRPVQTEDGQIAYDIRRGPLREIADRARQDPGKLYALVIDEVNRGNLSKIFGELYYLLEYRDESINLLYSDKVEMFSLPKNVLIIGTMNRVDRSIAMVDAAIRRRFAFVHLHPTEEPTKNVLRSWLLARGYGERVADIADELNNMIEDEDFKIGPSYFMRDTMTTRAGRDMTWRTSIIPLLEECHFGTPGINVRDLYSLEKIEQRVSGKGAGSGSSA